MLEKTGAMQALSSPLNQRSSNQLLSPLQLIFNLRWLVILAAFILALQGSDHLMGLVSCLGAVSGLLIYQATIFVTSRRHPALLEQRWLLALDIIGISAAIAFCGGADSDLFLLYPLVIASAALQLSQTGAFAVTTSASMAYFAAVAFTHSLAQWSERELLLVILQVLLLFLVAGVSTVLADALQAERKQVNALALLNELARLLTSSLQLDEVLTRLVALVPAAVRADDCCIALPAVNGEVRIWTNSEEHQHALLQEVIRANAGLQDETAARTLGIVQLTSTPNVHDVAWIPPFYTHVYSVLLRIENEPIGLLAIGRRQDEPFSPVDIQLIESLAQHTALAVRNAHLYRLEHETSEQWRELERMKSDFLSTISHELRLPLSSIKLSVETLLTRSITEGYAETTPEVRLLRNIERSAERLSTFVQELLDLAQLERGQFSLAREAIDVHRLVQEAASAIYPLIEAKGQSLTVEIAEGLPPLTGDYKRLEQVLNNLLSNAHQYTPAGGHIMLTVAPERGVEAQLGGPALLFSVRDTGPGISAEEQAFIFDRFHRGTGGRRRSSGAGLGLHIARSLVELHGGRIWVQSQPGQGSTFFFRLPCSNPADVRSETQATSRASMGSIIL
jgi:signal transduction histidine kinase